MKHKFHIEQTQPHPKVTPRLQWDGTQKFSRLWKNKLAHIQKSIFQNLFSRYKKKYTHIQYTKDRKLLQE